MERPAAAIEPFALTSSRIAAFSGPIDTSYPKTIRSVAPDFLSFFHDPMLKCQMQVRVDSSICFCQRVSYER
jgi:hypothetical protein